MNAHTPLLTEQERTAGLARLVQIAEAHAAGRMSPDEARREIARLTAPIKRRARRAARRAVNG